MKNIINKVLTLLLVLFVGISLVACGKDKDTTNKNVPVGNITGNYATVGDITLSNVDLYNELRANGYDYLMEELINLIVNPSQYLTTEGNVKEDIKEDIKDIIDQQCYGTSDDEAYNNMREATKAESREKFVDSMYLAGVTVENSEEGIYSEECLKHFVNQYAQKEYVKNILLNNKEHKYHYENEFYTDAEGKEVKNPYYVSEDAIASAYNSDKNADATYNVVIVGYETLKQAQDALSKKESELTAQDLVDLYKARYEYKFAEDATPTIDNEHFKLTESELAKYNSSLVSLIKNINKDNADKFTAKAFQQFGDTVYFIGVNGKKAESNAETVEGDDKTSTVKDIIDGKLTSSTISTILFEELHAKNVVIYDYVFDALYANENPNHTRLEASQWTTDYNNYVAAIGDSKITVDSFFAKLQKLIGVTTAMDYFTSEILLKEYGDKVTADETKANDKAFDDVMKSFEANELASSGLPASIGKDAFKFLYFGTTNNDEIKEYYKAQSAWKHYTAEKPDNYYKMIETFGKNYVGETTADAYTGKFFDLSVKHILLTVDYNGDGNPDDPEIFCKEAGVNQSDLETAIATTMQVIVNEAHYLAGKNGYANLNDALDYILKQYYQNGKVHHNNTTWDEHKSKFHFGLTIEDLGSVNNSTASKYVKEFGLGVQELYEKIHDLNVNASNKIEYLIQKVEKTAETVSITVSKEDLIPTTYGYHVLSVYDKGTMTSAEYTNDPGNNYKEIKIKLDGKEETLNAYSENKWASENQIKIYAAQVATDDGVTDLPSSVKTFISNIYSEFTTRYNNENFKNILFAETKLAGIQFTDTTLNTRFDKLIEIQKRQFDSYSDYSSDSISTMANWWEIVIPNQA